MVPADSRRISRDPRYSGLRSTEMHVTRTGLSPAAAELSRSFRFRASPLFAVLLPRPCHDRDGLGSSPFARHYWGNHCYFLFLEVLRCFSSLGSPHLTVMPRIQHGGLSHSEIPDSTAIAPQRGLSQLITSFIASRSPGIHLCALAYFLPLRPSYTDIP